MKPFILFAILFFTIQSGHAAKIQCDDESSFPLITKAELKSAVDAKTAFIIDVNSADSFKEAHVPGAIHYGAHKKDFAKLLPADKNALIVAYCGGVNCVAWHMAAKVACELGYTNVKHFKEGISGWKKL